MGKDNLLIAIVTCKKNIERQRALLDTWVPQAHAAGYDVEFFDGERLGVPDDYVHLPLKAKAIFQYMWDRGYDWLLKLDDDSYVRVENLRVIHADYGGVHCNSTNLGLPTAGIPHVQKGRNFTHQFIFGGGVWFSRKAVQVLVETPLNNDFMDDRWVGLVLKEAGIERTILPEFYLWPRPPLNPDWIVIFDIKTTDDIRNLHHPMSVPVSEGIMSMPNWPLKILPIGTYSARPALRFKPKK